MFRRALSGRASALTRTLAAALTAAAAATAGAAVKRALRAARARRQSATRPTAISAQSSGAGVASVADAAVPRNPGGVEVDVGVMAESEHASRPFRLVEPFLLMQFAALAITLQATRSTSPIRALIPLAFVSVGPGWALLRLWDLTRGWAGLALAIALSLSLATIVPGALLYAGLWSPLSALVALAGITVLASAAIIVRGRPEPDRAAH
jgi:hypothetical protein